VEVSASEGPRGPAGYACVAVSEGDGRVRGLVGSLRVANACHVFGRGRSKQRALMESLILAQDKRWRRA
jgi:hypothetical protein